MLAAGEPCLVIGLDVADVYAVNGRTKTKVHAGPAAAFACSPECAMKLAPDRQPPGPAHFKAARKQPLPLTKPVRETPGAVAFVTAWLERHGLRAAVP